MYFQIHETYWKVNSLIFINSTLPGVRVYLSGYNTCPSTVHISVGTWKQEMMFSLSSFCKEGVWRNTAFQWDLIQLPLQLLLLVLLAKSILSFALDYSLAFDYDMMRCCYYHSLWCFSFWNKHFPTPFHSQLHRNRMVSDDYTSATYGIDYNEFLVKWSFNRVLMALSRSHQLCVNVGFKPTTGIHYFGKERKTLLFESIDNCWTERKRWQWLISILNIVGGRAKEKGLTKERNWK